MVGYDLSETLLTVARQEADRRWFPIEFVQGDMRSLPYDTEFDAVINYFTSFGYFDDLDNARVVQQVARALKPEGHQQPGRDLAKPHHPSLVAR